jgi:hypothetical protein
MCDARASVILQSWSLIYIYNTPVSPLSLLFSPLSLLYLRDLSPTGAGDMVSQIYLYVLLSPDDPTYFHFLLRM